MPSICVWQETLYPRSSVQKLEVVDRRVILRFPSGLRSRQHGQEKGAIRVQQLLKPVTLEMLALTTVIKYVVQCHMALCAV